MIKRRIKRRTPSVVTITCTVKVISMPASCAGERPLTKAADDTRRRAENDEAVVATAAAEKRRRQMAAVTASPLARGIMREKLVTQNGHNDDDDGTVHRKKYSMTNNNGDKPYGSEKTEAAVEQLQKQLQQLLDNKSADNVRFAMEKFRQKEAQSLRERSTDVYAKDYVPKKYAKNSAEYGRPPPGSLTEMRANKASRHIAREMLQLCEVIEEHGHRRRGQPTNGGGRVVITFGDLFNIYQFISDKVVGLLLRARKHGMVDFEGEMLFQRRDEPKLITLLISHEQMQKALIEFEK